jgi:hypothetical protein
MDASLLYWFELPFSALVIRVNLCPLAALPRRRSGSVVNPPASGCVNDQLFRLEVLMFRVDRLGR